MLKLAWSHMLVILWCTLVYSSLFRTPHQKWVRTNSASGFAKELKINYQFSPLPLRISDAHVHTANTGATGVCPGTQYCTSVEDYEFGCKQVTSGNRFPESQNVTIKHTNPGLWMAGDAVLMNQNTFHRGWKHDMQKGPDRGMDFCLNWQIHVRM